MFGWGEGKKKKPDHGHDEHGAPPAGEWIPPITRQQETHITRDGAGGKTVINRTREYVRVAPHSGGHGNHAAHEGGAINHYHEAPKRKLGGWLVPVALIGGGAYIAHEWAEENPDAMNRGVAGINSTFGTNFPPFTTNTTESGESLEDSHTPQTPAQVPGATPEQIPAPVATSTETQTTAERDVPVTFGPTMKTVNILLPENSSTTMPVHVTLIFENSNVEICDGTDDCAELERAIAERGAGQYGALTGMGNPNADHVVPSIEIPSTITPEGDPTIDLRNRKIWVRYTLATGESHTVEITSATGENIGSR